MTTADPDVEYAFWTSPDSTFTVTYPIGLFHEIDFQVNEGYRRIPHGGVETGGLLFGRLEGNSAKIEAFRNIECEHASGPSFVLSDRDLAALKQQIAAAPSDPELHGLQILGWFIGHTRSPLKMNERESALVEELFREPGKITLLIKPERFQPTRFGFLVRRPDGTLEKDASQRAIILPLPGRTGRSQGPVPSIPAPAESGASRTVPASMEETRRLRQPVLEPQPVARVEREKPDIKPGRPEKPIISEPVPATSPLPSIKQTRASAAERTAPAETVEARPSHQETRRLGRDATRSNLRLTFVLLLAAALGCAVGYWAYSQLPSATIALNVRAEPATLLVSWPADQTRDTAYAAIRVDDGQPVPLSSEEKTTGEAEIPYNSDNVKIELIAQHRLRDSRGIVRYVKALPAVSPPAPKANQTAPTTAEQH